MKIGFAAAISVGAAFVWSNSFDDCIDTRSMSDVILKAGGVKAPPSTPLFENNDQYLP